MVPQAKHKRAQGPVQFVEVIWGRISNDPRVRNALNKTRSFISNGPFIAIVVGAEGESKPVAFAIVPVLGITPAGRVIQTIEEAASGKPLTINSVITVLQSVEDRAHTLLKLSLLSRSTQSLGALSVPGMVVGTVISGAVNAVNLLVGRENHPVPSTSADHTAAATIISVTPNAAQEEVKEVTSDKPNVQQAGGALVAENSGILSLGGEATLPGNEASNNEATERESFAATPTQDSVDEKGSEQRGYWYRVINDSDYIPPRPKL